MNVQRGREIGCTVISQNIGNADTVAKPRIKMYKIIILSGALCDCKIWSLAITCFGKQSSGKVSGISIDELIGGQKDYIMKWFIIRTYTNIGRLIKSRRLKKLFFLENTGRLKKAYKM